MSDLEKHDSHKSEKKIIEASFTINGEEVPEAKATEDFTTNDESYITIKPRRLIPLILLMLGMALGKIPVWFGGGLLVVYFGTKYMINRFVQRLIMIPFSLKGKALAGATVEVHGYEWTEPPRQEGEVVINMEGVQLRYAWIDVTVTPPETSEGFIHWEPTDLMLCPTWFKIKKVSDLDVCLGVEEVRFIQGEGIITDD